MKKLFFLIFISISIITGSTFLTSCRAGSQSSPEEEVRNYGKYFVEKITTNQLDSLTTSYPDISYADSIVPFKSDTIMVVETTPGHYTLTLAEGITLKLDRSEDGKITVAESKGLFAYPADKIEIAKKTSMWDDKLSDAQLNERMKDDEFFKWVEKKTAAPSKILSLGKYYADPPTGGSSYSGDQTIVNNTSVPVEGCDYVVIYHCAESDGEWRESRPGKPIPANGSVRFKQGGHGAYGNWIEGVKMKLSSKEIQEKFSKSLTGNEYQEYLDSKK